MYIATTTTTTTTTTTGKTLPEEYFQKRYLYETSLRYAGSYHTISMMIITLLLYFGSLNPSLQNLVDHIVPTTVFVMIATLLLFLSRNTGVIDD